MTQNDFISLFRWNQRGPVIDHHHKNKILLSRDREMMVICQLGGYKEVMNGWMDEWVDRWMDGEIDHQNRTSLAMHSLLFG